MTEVTISSIKGVSARKYTHLLTSISDYTTVITCWEAPGVTGLLTVIIKNLWCIKDPLRYLRDVTDALLAGGRIVSLTVQHPQAVLVTCNTMAV